MATQQLPGAFKVDPTFGFCCLDQINLNAVPAYSHVRTPGATVINSVTPTQQINQQWSLQSIGIQAFLALVMGINHNLVGKLGKIVAGLLLPTNPQPTTSGLQNFSSILLPLPDPTLTVTLWDPETDQMPPVYPHGVGLDPTLKTSLSGFLSIGQVLQLQQPVDLEPGETVGIGIWMLPSLLARPTEDVASFYQLGIYQAKSLLVYNEVNV